MTGVLVDSSVWVDHFRHSNDTLVDLLLSDRVLVHPLIIGEIACGTPPQRQRMLSDLKALPRSQQASVEEVMDFMERERLFGLGCGFVDLSLLASTRLTPNATLWTLDKRLAALVERLGVAHQPMQPDRK